MEHRGFGLGSIVKVKLVGEEVLGGRAPQTVTAAYYLISAVPQIDQHLAGSPLWEHIIH